MTDLIFLARKNSDGEISRNYAKDEDDLVEILGRWGITFESEVIVPGRYDFPYHNPREWLEWGRTTFEEQFPGCGI
ncbi:hypothetical protein ACIOEX_25155 [Streptomyces sp. NPDC087850]|uniref:hypothetical protein n=1 Tax=Streptomyces sp. NPDC087850 TaxID=3365809 RepID=UPI00381FAA3D